MAALFFLFFWLRHPTPAQLRLLALPGTRSG